MSISYKTREILKGAGAIGIVVVFLGGLFLSLDHMFRNDSYESYYSQTISSESWSPGTLDDAKRVVTEILTKATQPGQIVLSTMGYLRAYSSNALPGSFDNDEIVYSNCHMLLTKKDLAAYQKWLRAISKPYKNHEKQLTPPLMPPPWNGLSN